MTKLLILFLLLRGRRLNFVFHFTKDRIINSSNSVIFSSWSYFFSKHVLKHSSQGQKLDTVEYRGYSDAENSISGCLKKYLKKENKGFPMQK